MEIIDLKSKSLALNEQKYSLNHIVDSMRLTACNAWSESSVYMPYVEAYVKLRYSKEAVEIINFLKSNCRSHLYRLKVLGSHQRKRLIRDIDMIYLAGGSKTRCIVDKLIPPSRECNSILKSMPAIQVKSSYDDRAQAIKSDVKFEKIGSVIKRRTGLDPAICYNDDELDIIEKEKRIIKKEREAIHIKRVKELTDRRKAKLSKVSKIIHRTTDKFVSYLDALKKNLKIQPIIAKEEGKKPPLRDESINNLSYDLAVRSSKIVLSEVTKAKDKGWIKVEGNSIKAEKDLFNSNYGMGVSSVKNYYDVLQTITPGNLNTGSSSCRLCKDYLSYMTKVARREVILPDRSPEEIKEMTLKGKKAYWFREKALQSVLKKSELNKSSKSSRNKKGGHQPVGKIKEPKEFESVYLKKYMAMGEKEILKESRKLCKVLNYVGSSCNKENRAFRGFIESGKCDLSYLRQAKNVIDFFNKMTEVSVYKIRNNVDFAEVTSAELDLIKLQKEMEAEKEKARSNVERLREIAREFNKESIKLKALEVLENGYNGLVTEDIIMALKLKDQGSSNKGAERIMERFIAEGRDISKLKSIKKEIDKELADKGKAKVKKEKIYLSWEDKYENF